MKRSEIRKAVKLVAKLAEYEYDTSERNRRAFNAEKRKYAVGIGTDEQYKAYQESVDRDLKRARDQTDAAEAKLAEIHKMTEAHCASRGVCR